MKECQIEIRQQLQQQVEETDEKIKEIQFEQRRDIRINKEEVNEKIEEVRNLAVKNREDISSIEESFNRSPQIYRENVNINSEMGIKFTGKTSSKHIFKRVKK